jgi:hypothetical protein
MTLTQPHDRNERHSIVAVQIDCNAWLKLSPPAKARFMDELAERAMLGDEDWFRGFPFVGAVAWDPRTWGSA